MLAQFQKLLPRSRIAGWLAPLERTFYQRAFTLRITLWYLIFQRLSPNHHLSQVQEDALAGGADRLSPRGKRLSQQLRSEATASFSDARQRLPLSLCRRALRQLADQAGQTFQLPQKFGWRLGLLDGSTCRLRPFGNLSEQFAAHRSGRSQHPPYWCLARTVGIFCWATGLVIDSALAGIQTSEQVLAGQLLSERSWPGWLLVGDRNFGVYSVARALVAAQAQAILRLTQARAGKLARAAGRPLKPGLDAPVDWVPSTHDQRPAGLSAAPVPGRLLALRVNPRGFRPFTLYLFTTLLNPRDYPAAELAQIYGLRWNVELCFRYVKAQMNLGFLECHSADLVHKEWLAGLIAYNLIRWTMGVSAALNQLPLAWLSFSRTRQLLLGWLVRNPGRRRATATWNRLLERIAKARQPKRRKPRPPEPRAIRHFTTDVTRLYGSRAVARQQLLKPRPKS